MFVTTIDSKAKYPSGFDPDSKSFLSMAMIPYTNNFYFTGTEYQISGKEICSATDILIKNWKGIGPKNSTVNFWNKTKAFWPIINATSVSNKLNAKDPRDSDSAFRLTFLGGWTHGGGGSTPDGSTGYARTYLSPSANLSVSSANFGRYNGTGVGGALGVDMGVANAGNTNAWACFSNYTGTGLSYFTLKAYGVSYSPSDGYGFICTNKNGGSTTEGYKNGSLVASGSETSLTAETGDFYIGALNKGGTASNFDAKECRFAYVMDGLTSGEVALLNTIIQDFQAALNRANKTAYYFGDSVTQGTGASPSTNRWTTLLSVSRKWIESNAGVQGTTLESVSPSNVIASPNMYDNRTNIPVYSSSTSAALFIAYGINDCGLYYPNYTTATYQSQAETIIDYAINTKGWPRNKIVLISATYVNPTNWADYVSSYGSPLQADTTRFLAFQAAAQTAAGNKSVLFINPYQNMIDNGGLTLLSDTRHPNNAGYLVVKNYIDSQLTALGF